MSKVDAWGVAVAADSPTSVDAWNAAWAAALHFTGDPFALLADANALDDSFALGCVFSATYRILSGSRLDAPEVREDHGRTTTRADSPREKGHKEALDHLVRGDFTRAARRWDDAARGTHDLAAVRFAHDVYLHIGDDARRLRSTQHAIDGWKPTDPGWNFVASQHAFALEEVGLYEEAEQVGQAALDADPLDLWAVHALAHVYESTDDQDAAIQLLRGREHTWSEQDLLAMHIWWHLTIRLIAARSFDEVLDIHDRLVPDATTAFRLCDLASMLWRLELAGVNVGDRWDFLADAFAVRPERHTAAFLDLHAGLVYTRRPGHPEASAFFEGLKLSHCDGTSQNDHAFRHLVIPLVDALRVGESDPQRAVGVIDAIDDRMQLIGGSIAQREIITHTREALEAV